MQMKGEASVHYKVYEVWTKVHHNVPYIKTLQSDQGGEYTSNELNTHLESQGTSQRLTIHGSPAQKGKAEQLNHMLMPSCLTLTSQSSCGGR